MKKNREGAVVSLFRICSPVVVEVFISMKLNVGVGLLNK